MAYCFTSFILFLHSLGPKSESWSGMDETFKDHGRPWTLSSWTVAVLEKMNWHPMKSLMDTGEQFRVFLNSDFLQ